VPNEPEQDQGVSEEQLKQDPFEILRRSVSDFGEYDELALEQYRSYSFYFAHRQQGVTRPAAKTLTCERFGHDAPRGLCRRCGLGVDLTQTESKRERERLTEREAFLASRH
jgi:hypothetical protein